MAQLNQALRGACRLRQTAKGGFSLPRLATRQAHSSFPSVQWLPLNSDHKKLGCSVLTLPCDRLIQGAWFAVVDSPAQVARTFKATPRSWWFTQVRSAFGSSHGYRFSGDECPLPHVCGPLPQTFLSCTAIPPDASSCLPSACRWRVVHRSPSPYPPDGGSLPLQGLCVAVFP